MNDFLLAIRALEARIVELEKKQVSNMRLNGLILNEVAAPGSPSSDTAIVYVKSDGKVYYKNDAGTERLLTYT